MPYAIIQATGKQLPGWCDETAKGQMFWALVFAVLTFPLSLPRKLTALRFSTFISVMVSFFIVLTIFLEALFLHGTSQTIGLGFKDGAQRATLDPIGIFRSLPLIIFGFMYQCNIPAIYNELKHRNLKTGKSVL
jgi:amino acid permease